MNHGYLWAVISNGVPERISSKEKPEASDVYDWEEFPVKDGSGERVHIIKIASTPFTTFAVDRSGIVYVFANQSPLAIRQTVHTYSNQRWYPAVGWCSHTLPTERTTFSDEDGSHKLGFDTFTLRSDGWRWEEPWMVTQDSRKYDKEGWQYAFGFGKSSEYTNYSKKTSFVRRRLFKRTMRFVAIETWIQMAVTNESHSFLDIVAGAFDARNAGSVELFALSETGEIYRRDNITRNSPEGNKWVLIEGIQGEDGQEDISAVGVSPSHLSLFALSWDGRLFARTGISKNKLNGFAWMQIELPGSLPITGFSVGNLSMWVVSVEAKVFTARVSMTSSGVSINSPFSEAGEGMCRMSVSQNDQVLAISNNKEILHIRSDVSTNERYGKKWIPIVHRNGTNRTLQVDVTTCFFTSRSIPRHWIDENFVPVSLDLQQIRNSEWRKVILSRLREENERSWSAFKENELGPEGEGVAERNIQNQIERGWTRSCRIAAIVHSTGLRNWAEGTLFMNESCIEIVLKRGTSVVKSFEEILSVIPCQSSDSSHSSLRLLCLPISSSNTLSISFSTDSERDEWHQFMEEEIRRICIMRPRDRKGHSVWSVLDGGIVGYHLTSQLQQDKDGTPLPTPLSHAHSLVVPGHFIQISAGQDRVVWAIGKNGGVYVLDPHYDVLDNESHSSHLQRDSDTDFIWEHEKYAIFRGYLPFEGVSGGVHASCDLHGNPKKKNMRLPKGWSWVDPEWKLKDDWRYALTLAGPYDCDEKRARCRRRLWQRTRIYEAEVPWIHVDSPLAAHVHVQKQPGKRTLVWLVTHDGEVLVRHGCCRTAPQGEVWQQVFSDWCFTNISMSSLTRAWGLTKDNRIVVRETGNELDIEKVDWQEVVAHDMGRLIDIAASTQGLWALTDDGLKAFVYGAHGCLMYNIFTPYHIDGITINSDGTLYATSGTMVLRKKGTMTEMKKKNRRDPTLYEIPWEVVDYGLRIGYLSAF